MSAHKIQTAGNHQKERIKYLEHGESWKSGKESSVFIRFHVSVVESVLGKLAERWALGYEEISTI